MLWRSQGKDIRITMMSDTRFTFESTSGVAVAKTAKNKREQLQTILYEVRICSILHPNGILLPHAVPFSLDVLI